MCLDWIGPYVIGPAVRNYSIRKLSDSNTQWRRQGIYWEGETRRDPQKKFFDHDLYFGYTCDQNLFYRVDIKITESVEIIRLWYNN